jgi:tetratricopeptide (TPR) repeat protein
MKMKVLFAALFVALSITLPAQQEIISTASSLLHMGDFDRADQYLDSIIAVRPRCVDALMMKGNVLLNRTTHGQPEVSLESVNDESVYDETIGTLGDYPRMVDRETARKVSALWQHCVEIDPARLDIYQGLCTLYGMALMRDELLKTLPTLVKATPNKSDQLAYDLADYAQAFELRHDVEGCMAVYKKILELFPASGGLAGDIAVMYSKHGMVKDALQYARISAAKPGNDFITCYNIASMISLSGDVAEACRIFDGCKDPAPYVTYYHGITQFYHDDPAWKESMRSFLSALKKADPDDGRVAVAKVLTGKKFQLDSAGYAALIAVQPYEFEYLLLSLKAREKLGNKYEPLYRLSHLYTRKQFFDQAIPVFDAMAALLKTAEEDSACHFYLAYAQYASGKKAESVQNWKMFTNAGSFSRQSAACYFLGMIYKEQGKKAEAKALFEKVADKPSESKFANFCKAALSGL